MSKLIVILGITGSQGGSVAATFLKKPEWKVRGISRNPSGEASKILVAQGAEIVAGDVHDVKSLEKAFQGANVIFSVTDFWAPFGDPANRQKLKPGQTINDWAYHNEVEIGRNVADAAASVVDSTLELYIWSSLVDATKWSNSKYTWAYHLDSKAHVADYIQVKLPKLNAKTSVLQLGLYASNWQLGPFMGPTKQADGTYVLSFPGSGDSKHPIVDVKKDTGALVEALTKVPPGKILEGYGSLISWNKYMEIWSEINGVQGSYRETSVADWDKMVPGGLGRELGEMFAFSAEFGIYGNEPGAVGPKDLGVPIKTTPIEEYIANEDWSSILG